MPIAEKAKAPAKRPTAKQSTVAAQAAAAQAQTTAHDRRVEGIDGIWQMLAVACVVKKQYADAAAFGSSGHPISVEIANLADADEKIAKAVDMISVSGPYAKLVAVSLPLVLQLMANHGAIPAEGVAQFGVTPPDLLAKKTELEIKKQFAEMEADILRLTSELGEMPNAA
jgi:hypothetical protein